MQLHPRHFGRNLRENLVAKLMKDVEGTCSGQHGFVVAITGIENIGKGLIRDGTGLEIMPNYTTSDGSVKIQKDSEVRLKIIGTRVDATEIFYIGIIKMISWGVINDPASV
ncbi:hypothetical protein M0R45_031084 [Rubus argutus]|uniref:DNA-directed RNA polymerase subunit n=1 Tax=Rubus argutus TaxID=59490 RepID=A0AAW1WDG0_RUBAR